jgi:glycosyltransferase involved in cell wall biosynthesis
MEALSLEVPAIVSSARGNRELVGDEGGFVERTGDVAAIAGRMDWLIEHPSEARAIGRRGRERMQARFALEHVVALHDALYDGMLREVRQRRQDGRDRASSASR